MDCQEAVYSNDYYDIIANSSVLDTGLGNVCSQQAGGRYTIYYLNRAEVPPLSVGTYTILDQNALDASGITRVQTQRNLELTGDGIMIGFLDTGIAYENNAFRNTYGTSQKEI